MTTALSEVQRMDADETPPRVLVFLLVAMLAMSGYVINEPAPTDLLFLPVALVALLTARSLSPVPIGPGALLGMVLFAACNLLSTLVAWELVHSLRFMVITFYLFGAAYCIAALVHRYGDAIVTPMFIGISIAALVTALIGILAHYHVLPNWQDYMRDASGIRIRSTFKDPNVFSPFLVSVVLWTFASGLERTPFGFARIVMATVYLIGILFSFSRGAYFNLGVTLIAFIALQVLVVRNPRVLKRLAVTIGLAAAIAVPSVVFVLAKSADVDYFVDRLSFQGYDSDRFGTHRYALTVAADHPFGIGAGEWKKPRFDRAMHNTYLRVLLETGWLGAVGFIMVFGSCLLTMLREVVARGKYAVNIAACLAVVVGILAESMVIDTLHWRHLFVFLGLGVGLAIRQSKLAESRPRFG
ncbi:MAG: O-antigen ligase family protein [bacterium]|nr:O-antigen ligase family protein [bacterium]